MGCKEELLKMATGIFGSVKTMMCAGLILEQMMEFVELQFNDDEEVASVFGKYTPEEFTEILLNKAESNVKGEYRKIITLGILHTAIIAETSEDGKIYAIKIAGLEDAIDLDDEEKLEGFIWVLLSSLVGRVKEFVEKMKAEAPIDMECHQGNQVFHAIIQKGKTRFRDVSFEDMCENADILFA